MFNQYRITEYSASQTSLLQKALFHPPKANNNGFFKYMFI